MSIKFLVLGGGVFWVLGGGGADFIFMGARIFLISVPGIIFHAYWHIEKETPPKTGFSPLPIFYERKRRSGALLRLDEGRRATTNLQNG